MKKKILLAVITSISLTTQPLYAQKDSGKTLPGNYSLKIDTLRLQTIEKNKAKSWYESSAMPWMAALALGVLTVITNLLISYFARKTALNIADKQINQSTQQTLTQFHATLQSKNRQDWITDTRSCLSELVTQCNMLNIEYQGGRLQNIDNRNRVHEKVSLQRYKLLLLLDIKDEKHQAVMSSLEELEKQLDVHYFTGKNNTGDFDNFRFMELTKKLVENGRTMLYFEWKQIQKFQVAEIK